MAVDAQARLQSLPGQQTYFLDVPGTESAAALSVVSFEATERIGETFKSFAFKTHPLAYLDGGLAGLQFPDMMKIMGGPALEEWADWRTWQQVWVSGTVVARETIGEAWNATKADVDDPVGKALGRLTGTK